VRSIAACHQTDEVKKLRDKAVAIKEYARQAKNKALQDQCRDIQERAERRWGELYKPAPKAPGTRKQLSGKEAGVSGRGRGRAITGGNRVRPPENNAPSLADMGVSKSQSAKWQARAAIPEDQFNATLAAGKSTDTLLKQRKREQRELELGAKQLALPSKNMAWWSRTSNGISRSIRARPAWFTMLPITTASVNTLTRQLRP